MLEPIRRPIRRAIAPVRALFVSDASAGVLLILVAAAAMVVANSPLAADYHGLFYNYLWPKEVFYLNTLHLWINDGLMVLFFFVVGLEVKRELLAGQLSSADKRTLPIMAAVAGMAVPALIYVTIAGSDPDLIRGWAIPAATDIAFAMGVLGLLGSRVPASLRLFLLTVAIVDDIGAVLVIAAFYTEKLDMMWLVISIGVFGAMVGMNRFGVKSFLPFILAAVLLWLAMLFSGVHATIAGVLAALTIPMRKDDGHSMLEKAEHGLAPWSAYFVVPIFGFANAGVHVLDMEMSEIFSPLPVAIAAGLFLGKQLGIFTVIVAAVKLGIARKPENANWMEIWGVTILTGIGFTMSLFISELAFKGNQLVIDEAKIGILLGSIISAIVGYVALRITTRHPEENAVYERAADATP
ncbi:Na+/H+ antiporter NhaA [Alteriqipengyuania lutimaris]|uniref:Na(+)/H(+) antiporter NhaA n=1 Tax=Alteriqipengyuania lutimaris TaxID=1538146 RepID=A0A395LKG7_9SPHN|nr:Na+/H+ antiporter NhaA [Alteriqipengyuania lutimaris]MBB3033494.1 NhaA family Na+:H+ antiporter [Alteriqipengyuania lutimaris]RDS77493.1 Na+/H+ antiporter NhaA [Alteriqipengyuania lutimaris]